MLVCTYGKSCGLDATMCAHVQMCKNNARTYVPAYLSACLRDPVCRCVYAHEHMTGIQLVCPWCALGSWNPEADRASWQLSAPRQPAYCWGILQACNPRALELTSGGYHSDKQAEQYNKSVCSLPILCSVWLWKHLTQVFWCHFFMSLVLQFPLLDHYDKKKKKCLSSVRRMLFHAIFSQ